MDGRYLRNAWYLAAWSDELPGEGMLTRIVLETPLLLIRDSNGDVGAMLDRCPHRFAPLSRGRFDGTTLTCGYHGLGFNRTGQCVHNPHGPIPPRAQVPSFPIAEKHRGVWIWFGEAEKADAGLIPDLGLIDRMPATASAVGYMDIAANWQLIIDNLLDLSHADYLHPFLGGSMTNAKMTVEDKNNGLSVRWDSYDKEVTPVFKSVVPSGKVDMWALAVWQPPSLVYIEGGSTPTGVPPKDCTQLSYHILTPQTPAITHYFYFITRDFRTDDAELTAFTKKMTHAAFWDEDHPMLAAQQSRIGTEDLMALRPIILSTDAGAVRVRRKLQQLMDAG